MLEPVSCDQVRSIAVLVVLLALYDSVDIAEGVVSIVAPDVLISE